MDESVKNNRQMLAVVEENGCQVHFYHTETGESFGGISVGYLPHEIAVSRDGKTVFVTNFGVRDYDVRVGMPGASISVIDIASCCEKYRLFTFDPTENKHYSEVIRGPHGLVLRPPEKKHLYVNVEMGETKILVFDFEKRTILKSFPVNPHTHNMVFSRDGNTLWTMAAEDGVFRLDPDTGKETGHIATDSPVRGLTFSRDYTLLLASCKNAVLLIDPTTLDIVKKIQLDKDQIFYSDITPDNKYIVAPAAWCNQVLVIDVDEGKPIKKFVTGENPSVAIIDAKGEYAYISNASDFHVSKINLSTLSFKNFPAKGGLNGMKFVPATERKPRGRINLGVVLPLSGEHIKHGTEMMHGYEFWHVVVTRAGGLYVNDQAYDVEIFYLDNESDLNMIHPLTLELIEENQIDILLSPDETCYDIVKKIALEKKLILTPPIPKATPLQVDDIARGHDYFITTLNFEKQFFAEYNFHATHYSAAAAATCIKLQEALIRTKSLDYEKVMQSFSEGNFSVFY